MEALQMGSVWLRPSPKTGVPADDQGHGVDAGTVDDPALRVNLSAQSAQLLEIHCSKMIVILFHLSPITPHC